MLGNKNGAHSPHLPLRNAPLFDSFIGGTGIPTCCISSKDKSMVPKATHSPATARKGDIQEKGVRGACEMFKSPPEGPVYWPNSAFKIFSPGPITEGGLLFPPR